MWLRIVSIASLLWVEMINFIALIIVAKQTVFKTCKSGIVKIMNLTSTRTLNPWAYLSIYLWSVCSALNALSGSEGKSKNAVINSSLSRMFVQEHLKRDFHFVTILWSLLGDHKKRISSVCSTKRQKKVYANIEKSTIQRNQKTHENLFMNL